MAKKNNRLILWLLAFIVLISIATTAGLVLLMDGGPTILNDSAETLHLRISPHIVEAPGSEGLVIDPSDLPPLTTEVTAVIRDAATDDTIGGLFLEIEGLGVGWAQTQEMYDAVSEFVDSGKPCTAWAESMQNKEYYLASACDTIAMPPEGVSLVTGLSVTQTYFANALEKLGIKANFEHVGDFKSAVEPYERTGPSEEAERATNVLLDSLYVQLIDGIARGRDISPEVADGLVDDPPITAADALSRGMVDELTYRNDLIKRIENETGIQKGRPYIEQRRSSWTSGGPVVAVIHAEGQIVSGRGGADVFGDQLISSIAINELLEEVRDDDDIAAVVLRVNSPGGSGVASDSIWHEIGLLQDRKPVVVSMGDYAASGGYYISMGADRIFAQPGTITGSIGVFGGKLNIQGLYEKVGLTTHAYERGDRADLLSNMTDFDELDRAKFRSFLHSFYDTFVRKAARGRGMDVAALEAVAQGRVWTGIQAKEHGLIDELGGLHDAIAAAADLADISGPYSIERLPERKGFIDQLLEELTDPDNVTIHEVADLAFLPADLHDSLVQAWVLERILRDRVAALLPGQLIVH